MKKVLLIFLTRCLLMTFAGCRKEDKKEGKTNIVVTIYPVYDWVREIIKDDPNYEITLLQDSGTDLHNYQPTVSDMAELSKSDIFIYVGGESDEWVEDALETVTNKDMKVINLMKVLSERVLEEEVKEGMEEEEHDHEDHEEPENDEHIWLSLKNAEICVNAIYDAIDDASLKNNQEAYLNKLNELDEEYEKALVSSGKVLLFADRFPFLYLFKDYGLDYYAAFVGCSSEVEASFETVKFLAEKTDELKLKYVMILENGNRKLAETVIANSRSKSREVRELDSLQSATLDCDSYLDIMQKNLEVLKKVIN